MKQGIHPQNYRFVVFKDMSNGYTFLTRSTAGSKETIKWEDGNEYPLLKLEISNTSHPFFTGQMVLVDTMMIPPLCGGIFLFFLVVPHRTN